MPLEQIGQPVTFYAHYVDGGESKTGLTVTCSVIEVQRDGTATEIVTDAAATEIGRGFYRYILTAGNVDAEGEYLAEFKTAGTVDQAHIPAVWVIGPDWVENVDAASSTLATSAALATAQADLDNPDQYKADVSALATSAALATAQADLDNPDQYKADVSGLSTLTAAQVWGYAIRTLTQTAAQLQDVVEGSVVSVYQYSEWSFSLTGLGDISDRSALYFTAKRDYDGDDDDDTTILQIEETAGLLYIGGADADDSADGTLTVDDETLGNITIWVSPDVTGIEAPISGRYDVRRIDGSGVAKAPATISDFKVKSTVTKAVT